MTALLLVLGYTYSLWIAFLAVMALRWAWERLPLATKVLAAPLVAVAIVADVAFNLAVSVPLAELPREATFSQRMGRYLSWAPIRPNHWRVRLARWVCANLLDPFEIGGHCRA